MQEGVLVVVEDEVGGDNDIRGFSGGGWTKRWYAVKGVRLKTRKRSMHDR